MDPGTPTRPPDYYLGYTEHNDSHGAHDSLTGATTTHTHTTSTNPAAVRLLTSMDGSGMHDDDGLTPPSLRTSGARPLHHGNISAVPPQLPEIRPLGSSTSASGSSDKGNKGKFKRSSLLLP
ncbi:Chitin synthase, class 2 [Sporothrix stenoceras]